MTNQYANETPVFPPLNGLGQLLPRAARRWPSRVALITDERTLTFAELDRESSRVAGALRRRSVRPGDRVAIFSQNRWEWIVSYHAVMKLGAVVNPLNVMLTGEEVAYSIGDAGARVLLASGERLDAVSNALRSTPSLDLVVSFDQATLGQVPFAELLADNDDQDFAPHPVDSDALACIAYTSGTTGHPKGAMQSQRSLVLNCAYTASMHGRTVDDVVLTALPASHVYGNVAINSTFIVGGRVVLMTRFDPTVTLQKISEHRVTLFEGVPAMYAMLLANPAIEVADLSSLKRSTVGGQTIAESIMDAWERCSGAPLIELWGMTELSGLGTTHVLHAPNVHGSIGVALPGIEVQVVSIEDPSITCAPGQRGELIVRGPIVTLGYFNNPAATAEAIDAEGWLHTGDVATHDGQGHFFVVDRLKDMILTGGYNVYPAEIERVLIGHNSVALVAVAGKPDPEKGEVAHAYVVLAPGYKEDPDGLRTYCRSRLAAYKVPRAFHFVESLPTTSTGKLMRRKLRQTSSDDDR